MQTIYARKAHGTYIDHGIRFEEGGSFGTTDAGWSIRQAIKWEEARLKPGQEYQVERNGKLDPCIFTRPSGSPPARWPA